MKYWALRIGPALLALLIAGEYIATPKPDGKLAALNALAGQLRFTYHQCVALGWKPVPVHGTYYPGFTASASTTRNG